MLEISLALEKIETWRWLPCSMLKFQNFPYLRGWLLKIRDMSAARKFKGPTIIIYPFNGINPIINLFSTLLNNAKAKTPENRMNIGCNSPFLSVRVIRAVESKMFICILKSFEIVNSDSYRHIVFVKHWFLFSSFVLCFGLQSCLSISIFICAHSLPSSLDVDIMFTTAI